MLRCLRYIESNVHTSAPVEGFSNTFQSRKHLGPQLSKKLHKIAIRFIYLCLHFSFTWIVK
jgi:hypothetical protein